MKSARGEAKKGLWKLGNVGGDVRKVEFKRKKKNKKQKKKKTNSGEVTRHMGTKGERGLLKGAII